MADEPKWQYERAEGRYKHRWSKDYAGFVPSDRGPVGKCAKSIDQEGAKRLLNDGVPFHESADSGWPARIYSVYQGAIYEAVPTTPGESYHGYPWRGDLPGRSPLPNTILKQLKAKAKAKDQEGEFNQWLKKYGGR